MITRNIFVEMRLLLIVSMPVLLLNLDYVFAQGDSITFFYTGQPQTWTVPPCVFEACFTVRGAQGGGQVGTNLYSGKGATVNACIDVTPGEVIIIHVGGSGGNGSQSGGWNGGGTGHDAINFNVDHHSKGGGGSSDVRQGGSNISNRIIVAAGGGGKGGGSEVSNNFGGNGGCTTGFNGGNSFAGGGQGSSQFVGGNAGLHWANIPPGGQNGSLYQGGNGGLWQTASGGGGGGGLYGGGGGANDGCCTGFNGGGGGGGGSSLTPTGGTCYPGDNFGNGLVKISWTSSGTWNGVSGPPMTISSNSAVCIGEPIELVASNPTADFYQWSGPNGFSSTDQNPVISGIEVSSLNSGIYSLHYQENGCINTLELQLTVFDSLLPVFTPFQEFCQGEIIPALPSTANNNSSLTQFGITGSWIPSLNNQITTQYTFVPDIGQCALATTMTVTILPNPIPNFEIIDTVGCLPVEVTFENTTNYLNPLSCLWSMGNFQIFDTTASFVTATYDSIGCYDVTLTATYQGGCVNSYTLMEAVCVDAEPISSFVASATQAFTGQAFSFSNTSSGASYFEWTFGDFTGVFNDFSPSHAYNYPGSYQVNLVAYSDLGCVDSSMIEVMVVNQISGVPDVLVPNIDPTGPSGLFLVPNTFSPNHDRHNPIFYPVLIQNQEVVEYSILVYDFNGRVTFESKDLNHGWDGTYGGEVCDDGVYIWKIRYKVIGADRPQEMSGHVNLIR